MKTRCERAGLLALCVLAGLTLLVLQAPVLAEKAATEPTGIVAPGAETEDMRPRSGPPRRGRMRRPRHDRLEGGIGATMPGVPGMPGMSMMPEQMEQAKKVLQKYYPEMAERLEKIGRGQRARGISRGPRDRADSRRSLMKLWPLISELIEADRTDPDYARLLAEDHRLQQKIDQKVRRCKKAEGQERERLRDEIGELLAKQFEVRQKTRAWRLEELERQIKKLRKELERREDNRKKLIDRELNHRLGKADNLRW